MPNPDQHPYSNQPVLSYDDRTIVSVNQFHNMLISCIILGWFAICVTVAFVTALWTMYIYDYVPMVGFLVFSSIWLGGFYGSVFVAGDIQMQFQ